MLIVFTGLRPRSVAGDWVSTASHQAEEETGVSPCWAALPTELVHTTAGVATCGPDPTGIEKNKAS